MENIIKKQAERVAKIKELDHQVNGPLIEIANILGTPILARFEVGTDTETIKWKVNELRSVIKDVLIPKD